MNFQFTSNFRKNVSEWIKWSTSETLKFEEQNSNIFNLNIDCFIAIFDYLSLEDLITMGKTCKQLNQVAGFCYQKNYSNVQVECCERDIHIECAPRVIIPTEFIEFLQKITIVHTESFEYFREVQIHFQRLRWIELWYVVLREEYFEFMKDVFNQTESLVLNSCRIDGDLHDIILVRCPNLKRLCVKKCSNKRKWPTKKYPLLENFEWISNKIDGDDLGGGNGEVEDGVDDGIEDGVEGGVKDRINDGVEDRVKDRVVFDKIKDEIILNEIASFLELNRNIRKFSTDARYLLENRQILMASAVKLDELTITYAEYDNINLKILCHLLNKLYDRGIYKRLQFDYVYGLHREKAEQLNSVNGLVKITVNYAKEPITLGAFESLEEIFIESSLKITDLTTVARNLTKLRRIHFACSNFRDILPLISCAKNLKEIKLNRLTDRNKILNLFALNKKREKLQGAKRITLYAPENVYLAIKWAMKETDFCLIKIRRIGADTKEN